MKILAVVFSLFITICVTAQTLPEYRKVGMPEYIHNPQSNPLGKKSVDSWQDWCEDQILNDNLPRSGDLTAWDVYSDRANNKTYVSPSSDSEVHSSLSFGEKLWVADVRNGYALVFSDRNRQTSMRIGSSAVCKGWIHIKNLLLWKECPMNSSSIYEKGLVVHDPSKSKTLNPNPNYLLTPTDNAEKGSKKANELDILFIMKKISAGRGVEYYLLSTDHTFERAPFERVVMGWLPAAYVTPWNQRLVVEPTWATLAVEEYKDSGIYPSVFDKHSSALQFKETGNSNEGLMWSYRTNFVPKRMDPYMMRFPILGAEGDNIYKVASIASIEGRAGDNKEYTVSFAQEIEELKNRRDNINVIFVIDATASMKNYYPKVADALNTVIKRDFNSSIRIGAVLYKDYIDHEKHGLSFIPVTGRIDEVSKFISEARYKLGSDDADHWEAMFDGLDLALDNRKMGYGRRETNFIILIGDAGNHLSKKGDWKEIASDISQRMFDNQINFLAFQINHPASPAYDFFPLQVQNILTELTQKYEAKTRQPMEVVLMPNSNTFRLIRESATATDIPIMTQYVFATQGKSEKPERLKELIVSSVDEFQELVNSNIKTLESNDFTNTKSNLASSSGLQKEKLRAILRLNDWSESDITKYIEHLERGGVTKLIGYAVDKVETKAYSLLEYAVFFSHQELELVIRSLNQVHSIHESNDKKKFQDALIAMGTALLGEFSSTDNADISIDELMGRIFGVPVPITTCGFAIEDIPYMDDDKFNKYFTDFKSKCERLEYLLRSSAKESGQFTNNRVEYFWIPFSAIPGFCH